MANSCDTCAYNVYDEEYGEYVCDIDMDEDEYIRFLSDRHTQCPYYRRRRVSGGAQTDVEQRDNSSGACTGRYVTQKTAAVSAQAGT